MLFRRFCRRTTAENSDAFSTNSTLQTDAPNATASSVSWRCRGAVAPLVTAMSSLPNSDKLTQHERSALMARVRSTGNHSTEIVVERTFQTHGIAGWRKHPKEIIGTPDFFFPRVRLAVFVNGCFWHGCEKCKRNIPNNRRSFWLAKIQQNRRRDARVLRQLRRSGFRTLTIWEHSLATDGWLSRLLRAIL